jgi:hypothetical protein
MAHRTDLTHNARVLYVRPQRPPGLVTRMGAAVTAHREAMAASAALAGALGLPGA